jgi:arylsulfatase
VQQNYKVTYDHYFSLSITVQKLYCERGFTFMKRKNVLLITVDQWPASLMGCAGHSQILTPTLDELSGCGIRFTNAYSTTPVCIPARRELMTGVCAKTHGDRSFAEELPMPQLPTLAQTFAGAGYQTFAVGKLHVYPQRDRIGFDDVILMEEGRHKGSLAYDDYERFLIREGYGGMEYMHGMCNNNYLARPFHLPEKFHPTTWITREMCEMIMRKDPTRPAFWYLSYNHPHPPLAPVKEYLDMYDDIPIDQPYSGEWCGLSKSKRPAVHEYYKQMFNFMDDAQKASIGRRAFYALCTHLDHQIRTVIGTLREQRLLDDTIILFTADHGDSLGNHDLWGKNTFYEDSAKIPFMIIPTYDCDKLIPGSVDDRLVELKDVMPTLLDMAGITIPDTVEGSSLLDATKKREYVYGELWEDKRATRMIRWGSYKMIYCPVNNLSQLFDLQNDPRETVDLSQNDQYIQIRQTMEALLVKNLYGKDLDWCEAGKLVGMSNERLKQFSLDECVLKNRELLSQRGLR